MAVPLTEIEQHLAKPPAPPAGLEIPHTRSSTEDERKIRASSYAATWEGVAQGQRNAQALRHGACLTRDFALCEDDAWPILYDWNLRNNPPLEEKELRKCLENGSKYGTHLIGEKLMVLPFRQLLPESGQGAKADSILTTEFAQTDAGRSELFAHRHSGFVRFCRGRGGWWRFDGRRWTTQGAFDFCRQLVILDARQIRIDADKIKDDDKRRATIKYAVKSESATRVQATLSLAESSPSLMLAPDVFDADPYLLNCNNGTIDLRSGVLRPHSADDMITKCTGVEYDSNADLSLWTRHLERVLDGDISLITFLRVAAGYTATGDVSEEVLFLVHGPAAGGKTTTIEALKTALGDYALTCDFDTFLKRPAGGVRNDIARLAGARFVVSVEVDEGQTLAEGVVKQLTGGDKISARFLHQEFFEFKPCGKLWLVCNDAPEARHTDDALWRRIIRVPFEHSIPKAERNPDIKRLLTSPDAGGPAVLAWIVAGCQLWRRTGLKIPPVVENATRALRESQDPLRDFFKDRCRFSPEGFVPVTLLRHAYGDYAVEQGIRHTVGTQEFNRHMEARNCRRRSKRYRDEMGNEKNEKCWVGVSLNEPPYRETVTETFGKEP